ncbi:MAG: L,D-transpeptidase [Intrasporangiaceae bacterium]|nr:L,D-transpeptidase [Intrasporangiaceae bacterium]
MSFWGAMRGVGRTATVTVSVAAVLVAGAALAAAEPVPELTGTATSTVTAEPTPTEEPTATPSPVTVTAATAGTKVVGAVTNIWGTATGAPNAPVTVQALVNGSWSTSRTGTTDANGYYAVPLTYGSTTPGTYTFRAVVTVAGTPYLSPNVTLTRTSKLDSRCYTSGVVICASKIDRKVYYVNKGQIIRTLDARFGGRAYDVNGRERIYSTAEGTFSITRKIRDEWSYTYNARMPFSLYFYGGQAFHYSDSFARDGWVGDWGSHGCVNLRSWSGAEWLYNNTPVGTKVVVYR